MIDGVLPDSKSAFGQRVRDRLHEEQALWLTTVDDAGTPQPNPVWFLWEEPDCVLVYSRADSRRLAYIRKRPRVSLNFDSDTDGGDVVVLVGEAQIAADAPPAAENPAYLHKYADEADQIRGEVEAGNPPSVPLRIRITKVRGF